ncbi:MAG: Hsp20/alpha crystallin family protein [Proteocatella sp.]
MLGLTPLNRRKHDLLLPDLNVFDNMLDDFFDEQWLSRRNLFKDNFKMDVQENEKNYIVEAELPGFKKEEIDINMNEGRLQISVEREELIEENKRNYIHKERRCNSLKRSVYLVDAQDEGITAKLEEGVLSVTIPKKEKEERTKKIEIL